MPTSKIRPWLFTGFLMALLIGLGFKSGAVPAEAADGAAATKPFPLIDFTAPDATKQVTPTKGLPAQSAVTVDQTGITLTFAPQLPTDGKHPGIHVTPATGKTWDLSAYGHVEAKITNTSDKHFDIIMHVVDEGDDFWTEKKFEFAGFDPGQTKILKVIFGYQKGFKPGPAVKTDKIKEIYIFVWDKHQARSFHIEELKAAGVAGETPALDQSSPSSKPSATTRPVQPKE